MRSRSSDCDYCHTGPLPSFSVPNSGMSFGYLFDQLLFHAFPFMFVNKNIAFKFSFEARTPVRIEVETIFCTER